VRGFIQSLLSLTISIAKKGYLIILQQELRAFVEQFLALYALMGLLDMLGLLVCFLPLFRILWFGMEDYRLVVYREVGSIPEELLLGW
jgi:hypothetical protein